MRIDNDLFPFRFQFDRNLRVTEIGPSLSKLAGTCRVGSLLSDLVQPIDGAWPGSLDEIRQFPSAFDLVVRESQVKLRCQLVEIDDELAVLGSPRFSSFEDLEASGLSVDDFASHDAAVELLLLRDARSGEVSKDEDAATVFEPKLDEQSHESIFQILNAAGDIYLRMTRDGIILEATTTRAELLPTSPECLEQTSVFQSCPQFATSIRTALDDLARGEERVSLVLEISREGTRICLEANVAKTSFGEVVMLARDITEQRTLKAQLLHRANHDALTNLPNRTCFMEYVEDALQTNELNAVFFIDLDGFKLVNDRHGHQMGDELLMHVADTISQCLRPGDCAARLGGDEFSILLRGLDSKQTAEDVAGKILIELQKPARIGHRRMAASASIGIATSYDSRDITTLFQFADVAMYEAKARHKCCYVVFEAAMYEDLVRRDTLQQQLIAAGKQGQFINHYQPIVHIPTNRSQGFEALARWEHPIRGLLLPGEFLRTAEETDAIVRLGEHTVANVCHDLVQWKSDGLFPPNHQPQIHVNVSPMQLIKGCSGMLEETLAEYGVEHDRLTIEVKEQTLQEHSEAARLEISKLHDLGFRLAIDDFGAGNSSLAFLDRFPVTGIKLARSFVGYLGQKQQRNRLVQAVVELALEFGLEVVAVGVETPEQCELLLSFGCTLGQGEFFSEPISSRDRDGIQTSLHSVTRQRAFSKSCV